MTRTPYWVVDINCMMCGRPFTMNGEVVRAKVAHLNQRINLPVRCPSCGGNYQLTDIAEHSLFTESINWEAPKRGRPPKGAYRNVTLD